MHETASAKKIVQNYLEATTFDMLFLQAKEAGAAMLKMLF